jgi:hypothetical protein
MKKGLYIIPAVLLGLSCVANAAKDVKVEGVVAALVSVDTKSLSLLPFSDDRDKRKGLIEFESNTKMNVSVEYDKKDDAGVACLEGAASRKKVRMELKIGDKDVSKNNEVVNLDGFVANVHKKEDVMIEVTEIKSDDLPADSYECVATVNVVAA